MRRGLSLRPVLLHLPPVPRISFIPIASPKLRSAPPTGPAWLHEIKFDGFRVQLHTSGRDVRVYSRNGKDFTDRFPLIPAAVLRLEARSAVIDGELVSCDDADQPDFYALMRRATASLCVWGLITWQSTGAIFVRCRSRRARPSSAPYSGRPMNRGCGSRIPLPTARSCFMLPRKEALKASSAKVAPRATSPAAPRVGLR